MNIALEMADFYNAGYADEGNLYENDGERIQFMVENVPFKGATILDVGSLDGTIAAQLIRGGNTVYACDVSAEAMYKARGKGLNPVHGNFMDESLFVAGAQFDAVTCGECLEHVFDTDAMLKKIRRILKPGGKLILSTPNVASLPRRLMMLIGLNPFLEYNAGKGSAGHIRYYTWKNILDQLKSNNFKVIKTKSDHVNIGWKSNLLAKIWKHIGRSILIVATV